MTQNTCFKSGGKLNAPMKRGDNDTQKCCMFQKKVERNKNVTALLGKKNGIPAETWTLTRRGAGRDGPPLAKSLHLKC